MRPPYLLKLRRVHCYF